MATNVLSQSNPNWKGRLTFRAVSRVFTAPRAQDGDGVDLRRAFPGNALMDIDPFLLLDQMGPMDSGPGEARGFPPHPHRGFETVTYLLSGEMQHRDSWGNHGLLGPGDVQWMTAGSGLVHSEMPGERFTREGGRLHGFQLWINLPRRDKMIAPRYQDTPSARIPVARGEGVSVRVIAGESLGTKGVIETRIPILYLDVTLDSGRRFHSGDSRDRERVRFRDRRRRQVRRVPGRQIPGGGLRSRAAMRCGSTTPEPNPSASC